MTIKEVTLTTTLLILVVVATHTVTDGDAGEWDVRVLAIGVASEDGVGDVGDVDASVALTCQVEIKLG